MSKQQRKRMFDIFSTQLRNYMPELAEDLVICPHCGRYIGRSGLNNDEPDVTRLTLAHVIPEAIGGRQVVLACAKDNNDIGSRFESDLVKFVKAVRAHSGDGKTKGRVRLPGVDKAMPMDYYRDSDGRLRFDVYKPQIAPATLEQAHSYLKSPDRKIDVNFKVELQIGRMSRAQRAVVISAHLKMFWGFGYEYLLSPSVKGLVKWITSDPSVDAPPIAHLSITQGTISDREIMVASTESGNGVFVVPVVKPTPDAPIYAMLVPGPKDVSVEYHDSLRAESVEGYEWVGGGDCVELPGPENLAKPEYHGYMHKIWAELIECK